MGTPMRRRVFSPRSAVRQHHAKYTRRRRCIEVDVGTAQRNMMGQMAVPPRWLHRQIRSDFAPNALLATGPS